MPKFKVETGGWIKSIDADSADAMGAFWKEFKPGRGDDMVAYFPNCNWWRDDAVEVTDAS